MARRRRRGDISITVEKVRLGEFINFPDTIHGRSLISFKCPLLRMQRAVVEMMLSLNGRKDRRLLSISGFPSEVEGEMGFEVGVANGVFFDHLNEEVASRLVQFLSSDNGSHVLDFLLVATYYYKREEKVRPLRFDHHQLRFFFDTRTIEVLLHHVRGTRRLPLDELLLTIFRELISKAERERLGEVRVEALRTL